MTTEWLEQQLVQIYLKWERSTMVGQNKNSPFTIFGFILCTLLSLTTTPMTQMPLPVSEEMTLNNQPDIEIWNSNIVKAMKEAEEKHCKQNTKKQQKVNQNTKNMILLRREMLKQPTETLKI